MTTAYSAFFSSGLLAPHHDFTSNMNPSMSYYDVPIASPARPSSPMPIPGDSEIEDDTEGMDVDNESRTRRTRKSATPTPGPITSSISTSSSSSTTGSNTHVANAPRPRLRRRKSSLTVASSPMNAIKSPARTAGAALQLQRHLASPVRSRSGSLNLGAGMFGAEEGTGNVASEGTSLIGRMRSGSVGAALRFVALSSQDRHMSSRTLLNSAPADLSVAPLRRPFLPPPHLRQCLSRLYHPPRLLILTTTRPA